MKTRLEFFFLHILDFDTNELKQMKEVVERQHSMFREKVKSEKSLKALKRKRPTGEKSGNNELELSMDDLRFRKSYCQEVNDFLKNNKEEDEDDKKSPIVPSSLAENNKQTAEIVNKWNEDDDDIEILAKKSKTNDDVGNGSVEPVENKPLPLVVCLDQSKVNKTGVNFFYVNFLYTTLLSICYGWGLILKAVYCNCCTPFYVGGKSVHKHFYIWGENRTFRCPIFFIHLQKKLETCL